jgi:16S rRNA (cytosine967-C5)-methyltransferase
VLALDAEAGLPFSAVFDRVLLDAPCSGLGTIRRDPDIKWSRRPDDLPALVAVQRRMLAHAAEAVRPGGALVYATCSSEPEENERVVDAFLSASPAFRLAPFPGARVLAAAADAIDARGMLRTLPFRHGLDAFFAAMLVRQDTA